MHVYMYSSKVGGQLIDLLTFAIDAKRRMKMFRVIGRVWREQPRE